MILFRAINENDLNYLNKNQNIPCSLLTSYQNRFNSYNKDIIEDRYNLYFNYKREYSLNGMVGHVSGAKFKMKDRFFRSPWISTSKNFDYIASEYAIPQSGNYNWNNVRKPIILINIDDNKIFNTCDGVNNLKETFSTDFGVDLSNNNLFNLFENNIISNESSLSLCYDPKEKKLINATKIPGFSNFAKESYEVLIYKEINKDDIKLVIYPALQDILYSCGVRVGNCYEYIKENIDTLNRIIKENIMKDTFLRYLYPSLTDSNNLTDLLYEKYNLIIGNNIEEKYENIKHNKRIKLQKIVDEINKELKSNLKVQRIVDDRILVKTIENKYRFKNEIKRKINDIILVEIDKEIYKYNHANYNYINSKNNSVSKEKVKELLVRK